MECGHCRRIAWTDLHGELDRVPEKLRNALDRVLLKGGKKQVFHVRYPYGQLIVDKGQFLPPCGADACSSCRSLIDETRYSQVPLALLLRNATEVFIDYPRDDVYDFRFAPLRLIPEGELLGVFEVLDALIGTPSCRPSWSVSSGARSVWVLAALGNTNLTKELSKPVNPNATETARKVKITWDSDEEPHWKLIQTCAAAHGTHWYTDLIVFPGGLLESSEGSNDLLNEMLIIGWKYSGALRQSSIEDTTIRDVVTRTMRKITLPGGEMHHYAAMRHFLNVMTGSMPAYRSCYLVDQPAGPFLEFCDLLKTALLKIRRTKKDDDEDRYRPIVMQPYHLKRGEAGFYSCRCPSLPGPRPPRPERFLDLPEAYRDVVKMFKGEYSNWINLRSMTLLSLPAGQKDLPDEIMPVNSLAGTDFFRDALPNGISGSVYLKSPFLMSCIRLTGHGHPTTLAVSGSA